MTSDRRASFFAELAAIAQDPRMRVLARRYAGDPDLASDALQQAFYAVARQLDHPDRIKNMRAYFRVTLIRVTQELRYQPGATVADPENLALLSEDRDLLLLPEVGAVSADFESELHTLLQVEGWLTRLRNERDKLAASVPRRSKDPGRYRTAIVAAAGKILRMVTEGNVDRDDWTAILKSGYPEWFAEPDVPRHVSARRLQDARKDARTLLQALVQREHLIEPPNERARTADDAVLGALFLKAEQTLLLHEMPYNLEQGLRMFTEWLDHQPQSRR